MAIATTPRGYVERPRPSGLADVVDIILDKGIVIDAYVRVALVGIELLTVDARIVIASVDTYLRFAEAVNRLDIADTGQAEGLPQLIQDMTSGGASSKTKGAIEGVKEKLSGDGGDGGEEHRGAIASLLERLVGDEDDNANQEEENEGQSSGSRQSSRSRSSSSRSGSSGRSSGRSSSRSSSGSRKRSS